MRRWDGERMKLRSLSTPALLILAVAAPVRAAEPVTTPAFHDAVEKIRIAKNVPAVSVLVAEKDHILVRDVWGTIAVNSNEPATLDDLWHLGSDTKAMTATLAAKLIEQGKLKWTTSIIEACPNLKGKIDAGWENITLEQLVTQVSGIPASTQTPAFMLTMRGLDANKNLLPRERREQLIAKTLNFVPPKKAGEKFEYVNLNFIIAGHLLEAVTNTDWEDLIQAELFKPLGITTAGFGPPPRVRGHTGGKAFVTDNSPVLGPAGTVHISLEDWLKFGKLHAGLIPGYLTAESLTKLHTPALENYAMGWIAVKRRDGTIAYTHDGSNTLFRARIIVRPADGVVMLIALNTSDGPACDQITAAIADALKPATPPAPAP